MRVYHFLPAVYTLQDIEKKRIKIAEIDQLNDPFELWCVSQENKEWLPKLLFPSDSRDWPDPRASVVALAPILVNPCPHAARYFHREAHTEQHGQQSGSAHRQAA